MKSHERLIEFISVIPKELKKPVESRSWIALIRCFVVIVAFQVVLYHMPAFTLYNALPYALLIFFSGLSYVGLFVLCHDCGHYSFSRHKWVNDVVGFICFIPLLNSFFAWRLAHNFHHQHNQTRRIDPDWIELLATAEEYPKLPWYERLAIRIGPGHAVGLFVGFWAGMVKRSFFGLLIPQMKLSNKEAIKTYLFNLISAALTIALVVKYAQFLGTEKFLIMYAIPVFIAASTGAFLTFIQHSHPGSYVFDKAGFDPVLSHVHSTFNVRFPRWMEFFWLDINIHTPHHILPSIPWYHLEAANNSLRAEFEQVINERAFSFAGLKRSWKATELVKVKEGLYKMQ